MDSLLESLKQDVKCSLCNDTLTEPKILCCFHIFCKLCIKRHAKLIGEVNVFKCPKCKSETPLPEASSVDSLKTSPVHSRMSQVLTAIESEKVCSVSESHSAAVWYCFDCDQSICKDCLKGHSMFTKHHKIVRVNDMKNEDHESIVKKENNCTTHLNEMLELYCEDCDDIICLSCWKEGHYDHKIMSLDKLVLLKRALLYKHLEVLERLKFNDKERQKQVEIACKIKEDGERAKREVKENMARIISSLNESEREIQKEIDSKVDGAIRNLNIIHHIPAVKEYIKNILEKGLASEMVSIYETECNEDFIFNPIESCSGFAFIPNQTLLKQMNAGLGEVQSYSKTDHTRSSIKVEPDEAVVLKQANLVLMTKSSTGEPNLDPGDVIDVKISPEENVEIKENFVRTDGKIEVEFMAKVPGRLTAEVQVNGNHVSNSPLVMNVEAQQMGIMKEFKMKGRKVETLDMNGIAVNRENTRVAIADGYSHCVHVFNTDGDLLLTYGSQGGGSGHLQTPESVAFLNDTDLVIADNYDHRICVVNTTTGTLVKSIGSQGNRNGQFLDPQGVHVDDDGNIIVCDRSNQRVQVFSRDGDFQYLFGRYPQFGYVTNRGQFHPVSVVTYGGRFYISDSSHHVIHVFEQKDGEMIRISMIGEKGSADGQLSQPWGLAIDNDHHLVVCDRGNNRIQKFTLDGRFVKRSDSNIEKPSYIAALKDGQFLVSTYCSGVYFVQ